MHISNYSKAKIPNLEFRKLKFSNRENPLMLRYRTVTMVKEDWALDEMWTLQQKLGSRGQDLLLCQHLV